MSFHIKAAMMEEMGHYDIYTRVYMVINYSEIDAGVVVWKWDVRP